MDISAALPIKPPVRSAHAEKPADDDPRAFADELAQTADAGQARETEPLGNRPHTDDHDVDARPDAAEPTAETPPAMLPVLLGLQAVAPAAPSQDQTAPPAVAPAAEPQSPLAATAIPVAAIPAQASAHSIAETPDPLDSAKAAAVWVETAAAQTPTDPAKTSGQPAHMAQLAQASAPVASTQAPAHDATQTQTQPAETPAAPEGQAGVVAQHMTAALNPAATPQPSRTNAAKPSAGDKKTEVAATPPPKSAPNAAAAPAQTGDAAAGSKPTAGDAGKQEPLAVPGANSGANALAHAVQNTGSKDVKPEPGFSLPAAPPAPAQVSAPPPPTLVPHGAPVLVPPEALAATIARKALDGANRFEIRLDPAELGRLEVTIEVDESGQTRAHIRAERPEALELLQRDAKGMEQALRQAGLQTDTSSLSFSLAERHKHDADPQTGHGRKAKFHAVLPVDDINAAIVNGRAPAASGLDLRV